MWSPQGGRIAFCAKREWQGQEDDEPQIYVIDPDGGEARRLTQLATAPRRSSGFLTQAHRFHFLGVAGPARRNGASAAGTSSARKTRSRRIASSIPLTVLGHWLSDGRVPHLFVADLAAAAATCSRPRLTSWCAPIRINTATTSRPTAALWPSASIRRRKRSWTTSSTIVGARPEEPALPQPHAGRAASRLSPPALRARRARASRASRATCARARSRQRITLIDRSKARSLSYRRPRDRGVEAPLRWSADASAILCLGARPRAAAPV